MEELLPLPYSEHAFFLDFFARLLYWFGQQSMVLDGRK